MIRSTQVIRVLLALTLTVGHAALARADDPSSSTSPSTPKRPNVVVIMIDTLRADHLSQYGYQLNTSPGLERFASRATRYDEALSPAPWTKPSVASVFSGLVPARHGSVGEFKPLSPEVSTLAEVLQESGWRTAAFSDNPFISPRTRFDQGFDHFQHMGRGGETEQNRPAHPLSHTRRMLSQTRVMFDDARSWIREGGEGPFFLYLQPMNVHGPYLVPKPHRDDLLGRQPTPGFAYYEGLMDEIMNARALDRRSAVAPRYLRGQRELYDTAIHYLAGVVGRFFAYLERWDQFENTLIVITSDHGEEMFEHGGFGHAWTLYDEVLHVPLFIKLPGQTQPHVVSEPVSTLDIKPTILEALGIALPPDLDGRPLQRLANPEQKAGQEGEPFFFATEWQKRCVARGVRDGRWKLIQIEKSYEYEEPREMLFDLSTDPAEKHDVAAAHPQVVAKLKQMLEERFAYYESKGIRPEISEETMPDVDALKALGYVE